MRTISKVLCAAGLLICAFAGPVAAGDGNQLYLLQTSPAGSLNGNTLTLDQSNANNSFVGGILSQSGPTLTSVLNQLDFDPLYATQRGEGNSATLTLNGDGARLQLLQSSNPLDPWSPGSSTGNNSVEVISFGDTEGAIIQVGLNNTASLELNGAGAAGLITQLGSELSSDLDVGAGGTGTVTQIGNNNDTGTVSVSPNTSVSYTQIGNDIAPVSTTGLQVISSFSSAFGTITITQEAW